MALPRLLRGVAYKSIWRSYSAAAPGLHSPPAFRKSGAAIPAKERSYPSFAPGHMVCWNLWQNDGLSVQHIGEMLNVKEEFVFNDLLLCIRNGCQIDWVDICREAKLTPDVVKMLEAAELRSGDQPENLSSMRFLYPRCPTSDQSTLFRVMKSCNIDYQGILLISSATGLPQSEVERIKDRVLDPRLSRRLAKANKKIGHELPQSLLSPSAGEEVEPRDVKVLVEAGEGNEDTSCSGGSGGLVQKERQELLWHNFFSDPRQWWDNRQDKRSPRHPDFCHKRTNVALWLDNRYKPSWVDSQLLGLRMSGQATSISEKERAYLMWGEERLVDVVEALALLVHRGSFIESTLFYCVLKRCMEQKDLVLGGRVHALSVESGYELDTFLANHLICMYAVHGRLDEARQVFTKVASPDCYMWASIILAHARQGQPKEAIKLYHVMRKCMFKPDNHIFVAVLKACGSAVDLECGKQVHADVLGSAVEPDMFVVSSLVDMYCKCGSLEDARKVFDGAPTRNVITWTAMIAGYAQNGLGQEALALYASMQQDGMGAADRVTFICLLQACGSVGASYQGKQLHARIKERDLEFDAAVGNALVDMYAKCASLGEARKLFDRLPRRDVVTWTALLNGYAEHGEDQMAIKCFEEMRQQGIEPNDATFICLLVACSHGGRVNEGEQYFKMMVEDYGILPSVTHYNCMVDLFARSGRLNEAESTLQNMPLGNDVVGWKSLLSACKIHGDVERGRRCFEHIVTVEPENSTAYALLASMYVNLGRWTDADRVESLRRSAGAKKKPAKACIEVQKEVHEFTVGEERADISSKLRSVNFRLKEEGGHVPQTQLVLKGGSEKEREDALCGHAEKLALAYGLLNTPDGTTLLVTKNLRMCNDCHSGTKIMSRLEKREIIVRDAHRVHRFVDGTCLCGDRC